MPVQKVSVLERVDCNPFLALVFQLPITKFPCPVARDYTERLSAVALSIRLIIPRGKCVPREFFFLRPPKCLDRDCVERRRAGNRHGNVYRSVREKQEVVVYRQRVLQTVKSLRVVSLVLRGDELLKITNINPQQEAKFSPRKKLDSSRERRKWSLGLSQHLKGAWPNVRTESKVDGK